MGDVCCVCFVCCACCVVLGVVCCADDGIDDMRLCHDMTRPSTRGPPPSQQQQIHHGSRHNINAQTTRPRMKPKNSTGPTLLHRHANDCDPDASRCACGCVALVSRVRVVACRGSVCGHSVRLRQTALANPSSNLRKVC